MQTNYGLFLEECTMDEGTELPSCGQIESERSKLWQRKRLEAWHSGTMLPPQPCLLLIWSPSYVQAESKKAVEVMFTKVQWNRKAAETSPHQADGVRP